MSFSDRVLGRLSREKSKILNTFVLSRLVNKQPHLEEFDYERFETNILKFFETLQVNSTSSFHYCHSSNSESLYSTLFAVMTFSLFSKVDSLDDGCKQNIADYLNSFQKNDGLFYEPSFASIDSSYGEDWWGARNLTLHALNTLTILGKKPEKGLTFLTPYLTGDGATFWLGSEEYWSSDKVMDSDLDNKIMNVGCMLQYNRDINKCQASQVALEDLKFVLRGRINKQTGIWGGMQTNKASLLSRKIQFAYHLFPLFTRDGDFQFDADLVINNTLRTQNCLGGYGVQPNSSACEDIDSIEILTRFYPFVNKELQHKIDLSLSKAARWIFVNKNEDGGFSFRANESFEFGVSDFTERVRESSSFASWFRTLSIAFILRHFSNRHSLNISKLYGYEF